MATEPISPEQIQSSIDANADNVAAIKQKKDQLQAEASAKAAQAAADAQAAVAKANQQLSQLPQKIEDDIKELQKKLDILLGKAVDPSNDPDSLEFDAQKTLSGLIAMITLVVGAIAPVESIAGKVPVIGDLAGAMTTLASNSQPTTLTKQQIKELVPTKPDIPPAVQQSIDKMVEDVKSMCAQMPMLLINVIFQMLSAIYDMFDKIAGVIGVPPAIYPFSLVKQMPSIMEQVQKFIGNAPSEVKKVAEGIIKDKMAEAQALAIPVSPAAAARAAVAKQTSQVQNSIQHASPTNMSESQNSGNESEGQVTQNSSASSPTNMSESQNSRNESEGQVTQNSSASSPTIPPAPSIQPVPTVRQPLPEFSEFDVVLIYRGSAKPNVKWIPRKSTDINYAGDKKIQEKIDEHILSQPDVVQKISDSQFKLKCSEPLQTRSAVKMFISISNLDNLWSENFTIGSYSIVRSIAYSLTDIMTNVIRIELKMNVYEIIQHRDENGDLMDEEIDTSSIDDPPEWLYNEN